MPSSGPSAVWIEAREAEAALVAQPPRESPDRQPLALPEAVLLDGPACGTSAAAAGPATGRSGA